MGLVRAQVQRQKHRALCRGKQAGPALGRIRGRSGKTHRGPAGKASEGITLVIWCFPLAEHKMHKHALFRPQVAHNVKLGRFCIKMQILSSSGNMRKPDNTASIFLQNDCRLGWNSSCSQRTHTLSNRPQSPPLPTALTRGLHLHRNSMSSLRSYLRLRQGILLFCPHNGIPQIHNLRPRVVEFHVQ